MINRAIIGIGVDIGKVLREDVLSCSSREVEVVI